MSNRKATFAKRQRETDNKDQQRAKEARRAERRSQPKVGKGPEIAWDLAVNPTESTDVVVEHVPVPKDDAPSQPADSSKRT
jgi:hypothetical protein